MELGNREVDMDTRLVFSVAERLIDRYLSEGKTSTFNALKDGEKFRFPKMGGAGKDVYQKVNSSRAKNLTTGKGEDVLPADFVLREE